MQNVVGAQVTAVLPPLDSVTTGSLTAPSPAATDIEALLQTQVVYEDDRTVHIHIQLRNNVSWTTAVATRSVTIQATPDATLTDLHDSAVSRSANCPNRRNGICELSLELHADWVATRASGSAAVSVSCGFADDASSAIHVGNVTVVPTVPLVDQDEVLFVDLPTDDLYNDEQFDVHIMSLFTYYADTFELTVDVGAGIQIVSGVSAVANGSPVFNGAFTVNSNTRSASGSFNRATEREADQQSEPVREPLLTVRLRVTAAPDAATPANFSVRLNALTESSGNSISAEDPPLIRHRSGLSTTGTGVLHIGADTIVGVFAHVASTELVNMAAAANVSQTFAITGTSVSRLGTRRTVGTSDLSCCSDSASVIKLASCVLSFDGTESDGSANAPTLVSFGEFNRTLPVRVLFPFAVSITVGTGELHPISGWYDEARDSECQRFRYQSTVVRVVAALGVRAGATIATVDISAQAQTKLVSSDTSVISVSDEGVVTGVDPGEARISLRASSEVAVTVSVSAEPILILGLDVAHFQTLELEVDPTSPSAYTPFAVRASLSEPSLQYEDDEAFVVASAVLEDGTRVPLDHAGGLTLESLNEATIVVASQQTQTVQLPEDPEEYDGELVRVAWHPNPDCSDKVFEANLSITVSPPAAESLLVTPTELVLVPQGGAAAAAGYAATQGITVALTFPGGRVVRGLQADSRATYTVHPVSAPEGALTVSSEGQIITAVAARNLTGRVTIVVTFEGQNVSASVDVNITNYNSLGVQANPFPAYANSGGVAVSNLSVIEGLSPRVFERAQLSLLMRLMDGREQLLTSGASFAPTTEDDGADSSVSGRVLSVAAVGSVTIGANFAGVPSTQNVTLQAVNTSVRVVSISNLHLNGAHSTQTMTGARGMTGQLAFSAVLSNDRVIPNAVTDSGVINLPVFQFNSSHPTVLRVNSSTGLVTLLANYQDQVALSVTVGTRNVSGNRIALWSNLATSGRGDVDLGRPVRAPLRDLAVGETGRIALRVHTGGQFVGAFQIRVTFNATALSIDSNVTASVRYTIPNGKGNVDHVTSVRGQEVRLTGTVLNSRMRGPDEQLAEIYFTALEPGVHYISGSVIMLENSDTSPRVIVQEQDFVAGNITVAVTTARRRRSGYDQDADTSVVADANSFSPSMPMTQRGQQSAASQLRTRRQDVDCSEIVNGDTDGNGRFTAGDSLYVHYYVASSYQDFSTSDGPEIQANLRRCTHTLRSLDADNNGRISAVDAKFLLSVLDGQRFFVNIEVASTNETENCATTVSAIVHGPGDNVDLIDGVYFLLSHEDPDVVATLATSTETVGTRTRRNDTLFAAAPANSNSTPAGARRYELGLLTTGQLDSVGISVVVVADSAGTLYPGPISSRLRFPALAIDIENASATVRSVGSQGFNPVSSFSTNPGTVDCKLQLGICDDLPCAVDDAYLRGNCTLETNSTCVLRTPCSAAEFEWYPPSDTEDRVCGSSTPTTTATTTATTTVTTSGTTSGTTSQTTSQTTTATTTGTTTATTTATTTFPAGLYCHADECTVGGSNPNNDVPALHVCKQAVVYGILDAAAATLYDSLAQLMAICIDHCETNTWEMCAGCGPSIRNEVCAMCNATGPGPEGRNHVEFCNAGWRAPDDPITAGPHGLITQDPALEIETNILRASQGDTDEDSSATTMFILIIALCALVLVVVLMLYIRGRRVDRTGKDAGGIELLGVTSLNNAVYDNYNGAGAQSPNSFDHDGDGLDLDDHVDYAGADNRSDEILVSETNIDDLFGDGDGTSTQRVSDDTFAGGTTKGRTMSVSTGPVRPMFFPGSMAEDGAHDRLAYVQTSSVHDAVMSGDIESLREALATGESPDGSPMDLERRKISPLALAASRSDDEACTLLLAAHAKVTTISGGLGLTPLHYAAEAGNASIVNLLVQNGANPSVINELTEDGVTPLSLAVKGQHADAVSTLLIAGADPMCRLEPTQATPLHTAVQRGFEDVVEVLAGFSPALLDALDARGYTPLHFAARGGNVNLVLLLLEGGAVRFSPQSCAPLPALGTVALRVWRSSSSNRYGLCQTWSIRTNSFLPLEWVPWRRR